MAEQSIKVARLSDAQIASGLTVLAEEFGEIQASVVVLGNKLGTVTFPSQENAPWKGVLSEDGDLIDRVTTGIAGVQFTYHRGGAQPGPDGKSPVFDEIVIDTNGFDTTRTKVAARVIKVFRPVQLPRHSDALDLVAAQRAIQESTFSRLEHQLEQLFEQSIDLRKQLDESMQAKSAELEEAFRQRQEKADGALDDRQASLRRDEEAFELRRKEVDDSDNTFARRKIRDGMLKDVTDRVDKFGVSSVTMLARKPVAVGMQLLVLVFVALMSWTAYELKQITSDASFALKAGLNQSDSGVAPSTNAAFVAETVQALQTERIALWIRLSLMSVGLVASIVYYIRWQNEWAQQFASTEQSLKQFHLDVNRANWVVETCLEWRKETESLIPTPLIESLTRGLFTANDSAPPALHPADELASALMGSASKLSLNVGGNTMEIDKPGKIPKSVPANKPAGA